MGRKKIVRTKKPIIVSEEVMEEKSIAEDSNIVSLDDLPKVPEKEDRPKTYVSHRYGQSPMNFDSYIITDRSKYGYYWHDTMLVERQGWDIWSPVTSDNHKIHKRTSIHVDGTIRVGSTAILCYAPIEDVKAMGTYYDDKTTNDILNQEKRFHDEIHQLRRGHPGCEGSYGTIKTGRY